MAARRAGFFLSLVLTLTALLLIACGGGDANGHATSTAAGSTKPPSYATFVAHASSPPTVPLAVGRQHACAVVEGGVTCWGRFGDGYVPGKIEGLRGPVVAIAAGTNDACALSQAGTVQCWGDDYYGQLGDGRSGTLWDFGDATSIRPVDVAGLQDAIAISAGAGHTCAVTRAGGAKCWGNNVFGQLGDGTTEVRTTPVDVVGLTSGVQAIAAGGNFTCALMTSTAVKCWGSDAAGQLGVTSVAQQCGSPPLVFSCSPTPVDIAGLSGVRAIAVSGFGQHGCAVTSAARMECWGSNIAGQLGVATADVCTDQPCSSTPQDVGLENVTAIGLGTTHTCAAVSTGGALCWGDNNAGQLGDGTGTRRLAPVAVQGLSANVGMISAGELDTCAYIAAGDVRCWGADGIDELGDGTAGDPVCGCSMTPVSVYGLVPDENAETTAPDQLVWYRVGDHTVAASTSPECGDEATAARYNVPQMLTVDGGVRLGLEARPYPYVAAQVSGKLGQGRKPVGWELSERPPLYLGDIFGVPQGVWLGPTELFLRRLDSPGQLFRYTIDLCEQDPDFHPFSMQDVNPDVVLKLPAQLPRVIEHLIGDYISAQEAIDAASSRERQKDDQASLPQSAIDDVRAVWAELGTAKDFPSGSHVQGNTPTDPVWLVVLSIGDLAGPLRPGHPGLARYYVLDPKTGFIEVDGGCCFGLTFSR